MAYSNKVLDHYNNPRNVGSLDKNDPNVGTGMVGAPECGDVMKLQVKVDPRRALSKTPSSRPSAAAAPSPAVARHRVAEGQDRGRSSGRSRTPISSTS